MIRLFYKAYYLAIPLLIIGISYGFTTFELSLLALIPLLFISNRHTVGFFFIMYGGPIGGVIRSLYPFVPIYGLLIQFIGFILVMDLILDLFRHNKRAFVCIIIVLLFLGIFYYIGPMDDWAMNKYTRMWLNGILVIIGYYVFYWSTCIKVEDLVRFLILGALCLLCSVVRLYDLTPGGLFDYNWFREQTLIWEHESGGRNAVTYQHIGMMLAFAAAIFFSQILLNNKRLIYFYSICIVQLVLVTGCRQAIIVVGIVAAFRLALFKSSNIHKRISVNRILSTTIGLIVSTFVLYYFLINIGSEVLSRTLSEGDSGRMFHFRESLDIFYKYPFFGSGIGGYHAITGNAWPHNFFLELLCETGIVGSFFLLSFVVYVFIRKKLSILFITRSNMFYFLVLLALFVRLMVSSDLPESIELFSAIFAIRSTNNLPSNNYILQK